MRQHLGRTDGRDIIRHVEDGKSYIEHSQDAEPILDLTRYLRSETRKKEVGDDAALGTRVAIIPKSDVDRAMIEGWFNDPDAWRRWYEANPLYHTTDLKTI